ncbi:MAG: hypothetical protein M0Q90_04090 [Bacteroidales bacterium]|nr:hypothetical protein [Bacteroidales bacterium]
MLTNTALSNLVVLATLSSSVVSLNSETESCITPQHEVTFEYQVEIANWRDKAFNHSSDYSFHNEDVEKINTLISFTQNLLENSKDIESEYVDIVNANFWDLI